MINRCEKHGELDRSQCVYMYGQTVEDQVIYCSICIEESVKNRIPLHLVEPIYSIRRHNHGRETGIT